MPIILGYNLNKTLLDETEFHLMNEKFNIQMNMNRNIPTKNSKIKIDPMISNYLVTLKSHLCHKIRYHKIYYFLNKSTQKNIKFFILK